MSASHASQLPCRLGTLVLLLLAGGCASLPQKPKPHPLVPEPSARKSYWLGETATGTPAIIINLSEQRAHFFKGRKEIGQSLISSGKKGFATPTGEFKVDQLDRNHVSNLYGDFVYETGAVVLSNVDVSKQQPPEGAHFRGAKMPFFMRFHGGAGMHAGKLPGYAASHGCVRMPGFMAKHFFENAPLGTPVTVSGGAPTGGSAQSPAKKTPTKAATTPAKPDKAPAPSPVPASAVPGSVEKVDAEPEKKPEPPASAPVPPGA